MQWLNYHHLLYFWMVAREGGLAPAGKVLRLSQSALSGQIKSLEESLGHPLFERRGRKLELSETGRVVFRYAEQIFGLGHELMDAVRGETSMPTRLAVGISDVVPKLLVRDLLAPALRQGPQLTLVCVEDRFDRLLAELAAHALDVVIADAPVPPQASMLAFNHLLGESTVTLVAPPGLAPRLRRKFPASLVGAPLLLPLSGSPLRRELDSWFHSNAVQPRVVAEAQDSALLKAFAADGMGAMFVSTSIAKVVAARYGLRFVAELPGIRERFYAISIERRLVHPAVVAIRAGARSDVFT